MPATATRAQLVISVSYPGADYAYRPLELDVPIRQPEPATNTDDDPFGKSNSAVSPP